MFREKLTKNPEERGYLYIRESYYQRDRRTLKKKPFKLCGGTASKERGKYSKKKDIYCGKIYEKDIVIIETFKDYVKKDTKDFTKFKINSTFDEITDKFVNYLIYLYGIDKEEYEQQKKVYAIGDGYLNPKIITWLKSFQIKGDYNSPSEIERFTYRCQDCGIFDEEIINLLYVKIVPEVQRDEIVAEIKLMQKSKNHKLEYKNLYDFLKKSV